MTRLFDPSWTSQNIATVALGGGCSHHLVVSPTEYPAYAVVRRLSLHPDARKFCVAQVRNVREGETVFDAIARDLPRIRLWRTILGSRPKSSADAIVEAVGDRHLVLVFEDIDRVFQGMGTEGQADLRAWIENSPRPATILAVSRTPGPHVTGSRWWGSFLMSEVR